MKVKIILTSVLMLLCAKGFAQDIIHTLDSNPIEAKVIEITDTDVRYKTFDNQEGPDYRIALRRVVRIVFENGTEKIFPAANAEEVYDESYGPSGELQYSMGGFYDLRGRLYNKQVRQYLSDTPFIQDYQKGRNQFVLGSGLTVGGSTLLLASVASGAVYAYISNQLSQMNEEENAGSTLNMFPFFIGAGVLGVACLGAGIPLWIKGNQRLSDVADNYNQMYRSGYGYSPRLDFGPAAHGIGFTLRF